MRIVLLTRLTTAQGVAVLESCTRRGIDISAVVVEPKPLQERWRRLRKVYRTNGFLLTLQKVSWIVFEDHLPKVFSTYRSENLPQTVQGMCYRLDIPLFIVSDHNGPDSEAQLKSLQPALILVAGTRILRPYILQTARVGCINAHPGWLPDYRGLNANLWAFLEGGRMGITTHFVDAGVDTGAILLQEEFTIEAGDNMESIEERATIRCAELMAETVKRLMEGTLSSIPQRREEGRQFAALPVAKEKEVRRRLKMLRRQTAKERIAHGDF